MYEKKALYLGLDPSRFSINKPLVHHPIIRIVPVDFSSTRKAFQKFASYTHVIFTSRTTVALFFELCQFWNIPQRDLEQKLFIVVGRATAEKLATYGIFTPYVAKRESAEGIVMLLKKLSLEKAHLFYPHSQLARPVILHFLQKEGLHHTPCVFYQIAFNQEPLPPLEQFDTIVFTSPSTVKAFFSLCSPPKKMRYLTQGAVTKKALFYALKYEP